MHCKWQMDNVCKTGLIRKNLCKLNCSLTSLFSQSCGRLVLAPKLLRINVTDFIDQMSHQFGKLTELEDKCDVVYNQPD